MRTSKSEILKKYTKKGQEQETDKKAIKEVQERLTKKKEQKADKKAIKEVQEKLREKKEQKKLEKQKQDIDNLEDAWDDTYRDDEETQKIRQEIKFDTSDEPIKNADDVFKDTNIPEIGFEDLESAEEAGEINQEQKKDRTIEKKAPVIVSEIRESDSKSNFTKEEQAFFRKGELMSENEVLKKMNKVVAKENPLESIKRMKPETVTKLAENLEFRTNSTIIENIERILGKGMGKKYAVENNALILADQEIYNIETRLLSNFDFNVNQDGFWKKFKIRRNLDPESLQLFDNLLSTHKKLSKEYKKVFKKHIKKFADVGDLVTPRVSSSRASIIRLP